MAGIAGILRFDGQEPDPQHIGLMTGRMQHRGPDGIQHWQLGSAALGQCQLHTTPESLEEQLPLPNDDGSLVLVMDGRLDNWVELRHELLQLGANLRTRADAELVLRAYETWGEACLGHFQGDFALIILHVREGRLFCARDPMGHRPLVYFRNKEMFVFASEIAAILALPVVPQEINLGVLSEYLAAVWLSPDETPWKGLLRLPAAHVLDTRGSGNNVRRYWNPEPREDSGHLSDSDHIERYRALLCDTTRRMSRSQCTIAVTVSGGLDSSAVYGLARHIQQRGQLLAPSVQGYHLDWSCNARANESDYISALETFWQSRIARIDPVNFTLDWYLQCARDWMTFPAHPNGAMNEPMLEQIQSDGCRVVLDGIGGDEWLSGERLYYAEELARGNLGNLVQCWSADSRDLGPGAAMYFLMRFGLFSLMPAAAQSGLQKVWQTLLGRRNPAIPAPYWLSPAMRQQLQQRNRAPEPWPWPQNGGQLIHNTLEIPFIQWAKDCCDLFNARHALEARSPMNSAVMVQCMLDTPEKLRLRGHTYKHLHVCAMKGLVPDKVLNRRDKAEFSIVFQRQLEGMESFFREELPRLHPDWVHTDGLHRLYQAYQEGNLGGWPQFQLWHVLACHLLMQVH